MTLPKRIVIWGVALLSAIVLAVIGESRLGRSVLVGDQTGAPIKTADLDRRKIVDAQLAPYSALGKFDGTMACTAAIVLDPRIIVTSGHCITERDGSIRKSNLSFRPGYQAGTDLGRFEATVWVVGSKQHFKRQSVHEASQDWALLVLDRAPKGVQPLLPSHYSSEASRSRERQFLMPAYSNDIGNAEVLSIDPACSIRDLIWGVLVHDCRARYGSSGAPLLMRDGSRYAVLGIHTGSMFASDADGRVARFVGYRAIGSWMFADALLELSHQLNGEASHVGNSATY